MDHSAARDPFQALGLPARFRLDAQELRKAWMRRVSQVHPDALGSSAEGTYANDAFRQLSDPISRAHAMLRHRGAPAADERAMPDGFLLEMMDLREQADAARGDADAVASLRAEAVRRRDDAIERIASVFDSAAAAPFATESTQAVLVELNVVRAFDRMLEQLEREAGGG